MTLSACTDREWARRVSNLRPLACEATALSPATPLTIEGSGDLPPADNQQRPVPSGAIDPRIDPTTLFAGLRSSAKSRGLENRWTGDPGPEGSNPSPSAPRAENAAPNGEIARRAARPTNTADRSCGVIGRQPAAQFVHTLVHTEPGDRAGWPRRAGVYRLVAKDGTIAVALVVDVAGELRIVEFQTVGRTEPPARRPRPRRIADSFADLRRRAERRRLEQLMEAMGR